MTARRWLLLAAVGLIAVGAGLGWLAWRAPAETALGTASRSADSACLTDADANCLVLPSVTGTDLNREERMFPAEFAAPYNLVVMPFDRDQQVLAEAWLPTFQQLAADDERVAYYSIAALPDLAPAVRGLVMGGMQVGVSDEALRSRLIVLFLEEQAALLDALAIADTDAIRLFIMGADGTLYWRGRGNYTDDTAADLRERLDMLLDT